jgi:diguanylate cyclase (GGDEF)-like protein
LFELIPQAYRMIFLENNSPILILDRSYKVISANRVAKDFFRDLHPNLERAALTSFQTFDPEMWASVQEKKSHEWMYPNSTPERHYLVKVMEIAKSGEKATGYTLYYEDITAHKNQLKQMEHFALYDDLTRIRNRRYFFQSATQAFDQAIEKREKIAVIMFDLDDFKEVNDIYGHQAGDSVLHDLAALISQELDPEDLFARYGGEEFIIFLKNKTIEDAAKLARRLCALLNGHVFSYEKRMIKTTASFGVSGSKKQIDRSLDAYIKQADDALYQAKTHGKNQVFIKSDANM